MRCYTDSEIIYKNLNNTTFSYEQSKNECDAVFDTKSVAIYELQNDTISISQNNATKTYSINGANSIERIEVVNIMGNILKNIHNNDAQNSIIIDLTPYSIGTYLLKIYTKNNQHFYKINNF